MPEPPFSIIHVGFARTGTTSLQLNFFSHRDDIFYVGEPYGKFGGIFSHLRFTEDFKYDEVYLLRLCNEQIFAKTEGRPIVISDEILCDSPQRYLVPYLVPRDVIAFRLFKFFQPARIIFTIRKQEDYVSSVYLNLKRNSGFFGSDNRSASLALVSGDGLPASRKFPAKHRFSREYRALRTNLWPREYSRTAAGAPHHRWTGPLSSGTLRFYRH